MSIEAPQGILNIPNATLRVGKLAVDEVVGADTILNTVARNTILLVDGETYHENKNWDLKLPNAWAGEFECNTASAGNFSEFNFYNEGASSNAQGYNLTFNDTAVQLRYDGTLLTSGTLPSTVTGTGVKKVRLMFERTILSVTVDGTLIFTHDDTGGPRPRVYSTTAGGFLNFFTDGGALKNLKIVNEKWISDGTSNIAYVGGGEVAVGQALAFNRVSNVSQIKVDSNVVTEYTGPHDRPLRKYPEVALTADAATASGYKGYIVTASSVYNTTSRASWMAFDYPASSLSTATAWASNTSRFNQSGIANSNDTFQDVNGPYIQLQMPNPILLDHFIIKTPADTGGGCPPKKINLYASNDNTTFTTLVLNEVLHGIPGTDSTIHVTTQTRYKYFTLQVTEMNPGTSVTSDTQYTWTRISDLAFYGHEEGSGSLDTTLKTVYNVPATTGTQLEVYYDGQDYSELPGSVTDKTGNGHNGTIVGDGVGFDSTYKAFTFAGSDDYFHSTLDWSGDQVHSTSFWVKITNNVSQTPVLLGTAANSGWDNHFSAFELMAGGNIKWYFGNNDIQYYADWTTNTWIHLSFSYIGGGSNSQFKSAYMNGRKLDVKVEPTTSTAVSFNSGDTVIRVGGGYFDTIENDFTGSIANLRIYEKALNAGQVQELYDYQKDYFLGSKSQVTLYKGHLGVGVTEPSGQLELAGDERIQEYPPRAMTGWETYMEGHGVFRAGKSGHDDYLGAWDRWKVFNKGFTTSGGTAGDSYHGEQSYSSSTGLYTGVGTQIESLGGISGDYFILDMPYKISLKHINVTSSNQDRSPTEFIILGSNDGSTWTQIKSFSSSFTGAGQTLPFQVNSNEYFSYFGLVVTKVVASGGYLMLSEWQLFGTPGPTTLDKGSLSLTRSLDVPRISRYDVDTETPRPEKLVLDFDTTVNSSPTDISGQGNHGRFVGTAQYSPADKAFTGFPSSSANYITGNILGASGAYAHTQSYWINGVDATPRVAFTLGAETGNYSYANLYWYTGSGAGWVLNTDGAAGASWVEDIQDNRWYHVVLTYDGGSSTSSWKFYLDGEYKTPTTMQANAALSLASNPEYRIGRNNGTQWYNGMVSNPKVYSVALEPSEVKKLYRLGRTGRSMVISDTAVGIGKVPEAQLDVRGSARFDDVMINASGGNAGCSLSLTENTTASAGVRLKYDGVDNALHMMDYDDDATIATFMRSGNVGIGKTNPTRQLQTTGTTLIGANLGWSNQNSWNTNKSLQGPNAVYYGAQGHHWSTYSSRRLKENIETVLDSLDKVKKLRGVYFTWKNGQGDNMIPNDLSDYDTTQLIKQQKQLGFIADEVGEVLPSIVTFEVDGHASGLDYSAVTPVLVNAIKELDDKIGKSEASSDDRLKDNEVHVRNATETLMKLKPQIYDKKESLTSNVYQHEAGLIAQDIWYDAPELRFAVKPGLLSEIPLEAPIRSDDPREDPDYSTWGPNPASVDYNYLIPYVIKSIQEITTELPKEKVKVLGVTKTNLDARRGLIVSASNDEFSISSVQQDKKCFGVISYSNTYSNNNEILVDTTGIGKVWVINTTDIESGDYITSSSINGYAMKQSDEILHSYTLSKSMTDCNFSPTSTPIKRIRQELNDVTYYINTKLYDITKEQYDSLDELYRTSREYTFYTKSDYVKVSGEGGYDKLEYKRGDEVISSEAWNILENITQNTYSVYYSNLATTHVSLEDYSTIDETEKEKCVLSTEIIYSYKIREESKSPLPGYEPEIRKEMVDILDANGQIQWEDDPSGATKSIYEIRYLDAGGNITDEANAVHTAALITCKYC